LIISLTFLISVISTDPISDTITDPISDTITASHIVITEDGKLYDSELAVTTTIYGRTMTIDPGSHQRIIDVAGKVDLKTGNLPIDVIFSACFEGEAVDDGIATYDYNTNQISFVSNGAFNGVVFTADMTKNTIMPPTSFYLNPVVFLGYDGVTQRRVITGVNTPGKNFIFFEKPNFGDVELYAIPSTLPVTSNDAYDGKSGNYYTVQGASLIAWNVLPNTTTSFTLACIPPNSYISGALLVNPINTNIIYAILDTGDNYNLTSIDLTAKSCKIVGGLDFLPPVPRIIIASEIGNLSGNIAVSVASDEYNAVIIFDPVTLKVAVQVKSEDVFEDIFLQETNTMRF